jgi:tRNA-2-methylthio-N6-dimethylallyladenosine synthase
MIYRTEFDASSNDIKYVKKFTDAYYEKNGKRPGVFIRTFGCQQNEADSERYMGMAVLMGYEKVDCEENALLILYNTCAVREHAELK